MLHNRDLWLINLGFIAVLWNLWFFSFWSVSIVSDAAHSSFGRSALIAAFNAGAGILGFPVGGWLSDVAVRRGIGRKPLIVAFTGLQCVLTAAFTVVVASGSANVWVMAALLIWQGTGMVVKNTMDRENPLVGFWVGTHASVGSVIFLLILIRFAWAFAQRGKRPAYAEGTIGRLAAAAHKLMYVLMLVVPTLGLLRLFGRDRAGSLFGVEVHPAMEREIAWMTAPADAVHAAQVLHAATSIAIHWGTFMLGDDGRNEPVDSLRAALAALPARCRPVFLAPDNGQSVEVPPIGGTARLSAAADSACVPAGAEARLRSR